MISRHSLLAVFLTGLVSTTVLAAPPRFNGTDAVITSSETAAVNTAPATTAATATAVQPEATPAAPAADAMQTPAPSSTATAATTANGTDKPAAETPKKSGSWLANLFRKRDPTVPTTKTRKDSAELVNTERHHEESYELLRIADLHRFEPGYDEVWHVQASNVMCALTQQVPNYGRVEFREGVGQPLEFAMYVAHPPAGSGVVRVRSEPPRWQHHIQDKNLGTLELEDSERAITAPAQWSRRLMLELSEGMQPVFSFWDAADASDDIEIFLSAIRFREGLDLFHRCLGQLIRYDFKQVQLNVVHFHPDSSKLRKQTTDELDEILETLKVDKSITQVNLEIYTQRDGLERYNFRLATRRAQAVRDYLIKHGIKEDILYIKIHTKTKAQLTELGYKDSDVYISLQRDKQK